MFLTNTKYLQLPMNPLLMYTKTLEEVDSEL